MASPNFQTPDGKTFAEFRDEIRSYNLGEWQQRGYDEALYPDPLDWLVKKHTDEDKARAKELSSLNLYQRMAYSSGRLLRLELRSLYSQPSQSMYEVDSAPDRFGWTRHPIHAVANNDSWKGEHIEGGYRCVYMGETSNHELLQYVNDCFVSKHGDDYIITERLALNELTSAGAPVRTVFEEFTQRPDGYTHRSKGEALAAALKLVFDDWRDAFYETPDQRFARND